MSTLRDLPAIPVFDIRAGGPARYAIEARERSRALRDGCLTFLPPPARLLLPLLDRLTRQWLGRSRSPYVAEIETIAAELGFSGIWFLNGCYEWGCTAAARDEDGAPWLARTLDWPFHGLGRRLEIARMRGAAGEFLNVTWPGYVGTLTATAPGRFAAAINQAPLYRRTRRPWLRPLDIAVNAVRTWPLDFRPPDHLLREVFESCDDFAAARRRLETTPVARPVIYTLVGCRRGERCVIERTEQDFVSRADDTTAANDWQHSAGPWEARVPSNVLWTRPWAEAAARSRARSGALAAWPQPFARGDFAWVMPPVLNHFTRLAVEMCPARATLRAVGYELAPGGELPQPVAQMCEPAVGLASVPA